MILTISAPTGGIAVVLLLVLLSQLCNPARADEGPLRAAPQQASSVPATPAPTSTKPADPAWERSMIRDRERSDHQWNEEERAKLGGLTLSPENRTHTKYSVEITTLLKGQPLRVSVLAGAEGHWTVFEISDVEEYRFLLSSTNNRDTIWASFGSIYVYDPDRRFILPSGVSGPFKRSSFPITIDAGRADAATRPSKKSDITYHVLAKEWIAPTKPAAATAATDAAKAHDEQRPKEPASAVSKSGKFDFQSPVEAFAKSAGLEIRSDKFKTDTHYIAEVTTLNNGTEVSQESLPVVEGHWTTVETTNVKKYRVLVSQTDKQDTLLIAFIPEYTRTTDGRYLNRTGAIKASKRADGTYKLVAGNDGPQGEAKPPVTYQVVIKTLDVQRPG